MAPKKKGSKDGGSNSSIPQSNPPRFSYPPIPQPQYPSYPPQNFQGQMPPATRPPSMPYPLPNSGYAPYPQEHGHPPGPGPYYHGHPQGYYQPPPPQPGYPAPSPYPAYQPPPPQSGYPAPSPHSGCQAPPPQPGYPAPPPQPGYQGYMPPQQSYQGPHGHAASSQSQNQAPTTSQKPKPRKPKVSSKNKDSPPSYDEVVGASGGTHADDNNIYATKSVDKDIHPAKSNSGHPSGDSTGNKDRGRMNSPDIRVDFPHRSSTPTKRGRGDHCSARNSRGFGRGGGTQFLPRGSRGNYRGRGFMPRGSRGRGARYREPRHASDIDVRSEATTSSIGRDQDEFSVEMLRQLIGELDISTTATDPRGILVEVRNGYSDYHPLALKNFLEHCTGNQCHVISMVISTDRKSAIAIFDTDIDYDDLGTFVTEPQNQFLDLELDFDEIDEVSSLIVFTYEVVEVEDVVHKIELVSAQMAQKIQDKRSADEFILISFDDATQDELMTLISDMRAAYDNLDVYPLYPYPSNEYMHVVIDSYSDFEVPVDSDGVAAEDFQILLSQVDKDRGDKELRKIMTIERFSGGDSTAKVLPASRESQRIVTYTKPEVCTKVLSRSPIEREEKLVGHVSLGANVPVDESSDLVSSYFLMLTGIVDNKENLTKDVLKYFCANYAKLTVCEVYFTSEETEAVVMFSATAGDRKPDFVNVCRGLTHTSAFSGVKAWRLSTITSVEISGIYSTISTSSDVKELISTWSLEAEVRVSCDSVSKQTAVLNFRNERDAVKFLSRSGDSHPKVSFGEYSLEIPIVATLNYTRIFSERLGSITPHPVSISGIVEELGYTDDHTNYLKRRIGKDLRKVLSKYQAKTSGENIFPDVQNVGCLDQDPVKVFCNWRSGLKAGIGELLVGVSMMDECTVSKSQWNDLKHHIPSGLYVVDEVDGPRNMKLRALGNATDVRNFEDKIRGSDIVADAPSRTITMPLSDATFIKSKYLQGIKEDFPEASIDVSFGSELATAIVKGSDDDFGSIQSRLSEYQAALKHRSITIATAKWDFLNSRKSRAFLYINGLLDASNTKYTCKSKSATERLIVLTTHSDTKESLNEAERTLRDTIIVETVTLTDDMSKHTWSFRSKPDIERVISHKKLPLHIVEPKDGTGKVQIVTVEAAQSYVQSILPIARSPPAPSAASAGGAKSKKPANKKSAVKRQQKTAAEENQKTIPSLLDGLNMDMRPNTPPAPRSVSRGISNTSSNEDGYTETIRLSMNHQYIEYQFSSKYLAQLLRSDCLERCDLGWDPKTKQITIKSADLQELKSTKKAVLDVIKSLYKDTREIKSGADANSFKRAACDLKVQYLIHESVQIMDYSVGTVSVVACKRTIQCVKADAMIIAVKSDLYMNQSGIGSVLAIADPASSKELRGRYMAELIDSPGSCQEIPSTTGSTLYGLYIVIVVDTKNKRSLEEGFANALGRADKLRLSSVVTNLIGSDMKDFVSDKESATIIMDCLSKHVRSPRGKLHLQTMFVCETNDHKLSSLTEEVKKYGRGVEYLSDTQPDVGSKMLSVCAASRYDGEEFIRRCRDALE